MAVRRGEIASVARRWRESLAVAVLLLVALALRVFQVDWDQGHLYHPDERYILMTTAGLNLPWPPDLAQLLTPQSPLDPHGFAYGSFSFYLLRLTGVILVAVGHLLPPLGFLTSLADLANLRLVGRPISALFDTTTVLIVYQIGRRLYGRRAAFLGAALVTFSVLDIQLSHFYATDTIMTCFVLAAILASLRYLESGRTSVALWAGAFTGLALATKVSAAPVLAPVVAAYGLRLVTVEDPGQGIFWRTPRTDELADALGTLLKAFLVGAAVFVVAEPYAILDFSTFAQSVADQGNMVRGIADLPYTRQFIGRPAYLYFLQILTLFGVGLPLGIAMVAGAVYVVGRAIRRPRRGDLILLSFVVPYFLITGSFYAKFLRYMLPIAPLLALFAAVALIDLLDLVQSWRRWGGSAGRTADWREESGDSDGVVEPLVPEVLEEALPDDLADLERLDGPPATLDGTEAAPGDLLVAPAVALAGPQLADPEALRFAQIKGLSLEALLEEPAGLAQGRASDPGRSMTLQDLVEAVPLNRATPGWIQARPTLARLVAGALPTRLAWLLIGTVVGFSVFYSLAFDHMYQSTSTPVEGSIWLYQHAPPGSLIATEHWEEGMPVPLATSSGVVSADSQRYHVVTMPMYDDDTPSKLETIVNNLEAADYVVFFSNRLYGTVPRLPGRYPMSRRYYEQLFGEKLGFRLVAAFDRYPSLLGVAFVDDTFNDPGLPTPRLLQTERPAPVTINLGHADESFSVYDHQKVLIFQKFERLSPDQLRALIGPPPLQRPLDREGLAPAYKPLVFTPVQEAAVQAGGTFRDLFDRSDLANRYPLLTWIVLILAISLAAVPLGFFTFRFLPDRGYLASKSLGILFLAWLSWMVVCLDVTEATRAEALWMLAVYLAIGLVAGWAQRREIQAFLVHQWRLLAIEEGLFWLAFSYDLFIRSLDPDLWHPVLGGEKPMDLAYFTAAARSPIYPPYDPWFAGGYLNYYYFGQVIVGTLTRLSGVLPTTSYNVVVPLLFALTVGGAFSAALALLWPSDPERRRAAVIGGLLASLMVCVLGNLGGFIQVVQQLSQDGSTTPSDTIGSAAVAAVSGAFAVLTGQKPFVIPQDWYWSSTRMLALLGLKGTGSINEFPYFTFLFADLHAHLIALPFTLLAIVLSVNLVRSRGGNLATSGLPGWLAGGDAGRLSFDQADTAGLESRGERLAGLATLATAALVVGALFPMNSWDYPTYLGLIGVSLVIPWYLSRQRQLGGLLAAIGCFVIILALGRLLYWPFYQYFQSFYSGVHPSDEKSTIPWFFAINGLFLVVVLSFFAIQGWSLYRRTAIVRTLRLYLGKWDLLPRAIELQRVLVKEWDPREIAALYAIGWSLILLIGSFVFGVPLTGALVVLLLITLWFGLRRDQSPGECLTVALFGTGLALAIGTEQVTIDGDVGRMNTVFKFYEQIWVLWGVASAVLVVRSWERLRKSSALLVRRLWLGTIIGFVLMASIYPVIGTIARVSNRFSTDLAPTLDGMAYMDRAVYVDDGKPLHLITDKEAIIWLQDHVTGTPIILEGNRPLYRWGSRISIYTGLPTVIGWDWHQKQQRWGYQDLVDNRLADVKRMYDDPSVDLTTSLLRSYQVRYIVDGELEQAFYPKARAKFDSMVGSVLSVVYDRDGVRIYRVK